MDLTLPHLQERRAICANPGLSTSPLPNRRLPRPPPDTPAAGGTGKPDLQHVHIVGVPREPADGVVEVAVRLDRLFAGVGLPFDGEVPVELRGGPAPFFVLAARW